MQFVKFSNKMDLPILIRTFASIKHRPAVSVKFGEIFFSFLTT